MGDFYGIGIEIWAGFGPVGITEKRKIWADYEHFFRPFFSSVSGQIIQTDKNIVAFALKSCIK